MVKSSDTPFQENSGFKSTEANKRKMKKNCYDKAKIALGERGFTSYICNPFSEKKSSRVVMNPSLQHTTTSHNVNQLAELGFTNRWGRLDSGPHVSEIPQIEQLRPATVSWNQWSAGKAESQCRTAETPAGQRKDKWGPPSDYKVRHLCRSSFIHFSMLKLLKLDTVHQCQTSSPLLNHLTTSQQHHPNDHHLTASASLDICPSVAPGVTKKFVGVSW